MNVLSVCFYVPPCEPGACGGQKGKGIGSPDLELQVTVSLPGVLGVNPTQVLCKQQVFLNPKFSLQPES